VTDTLVDVGTAKSFAFRDLDAQADDMIQFALEAATTEIEGRIAPRRIIAADYDEWYDGEKTVGRYGHELYLDQWPLISVTSVSESGTALSVGKGYSQTLQVLMNPGRGILTRRQAGGDLVVAEALSIAGFPGKRGWTRDAQNIRVAYRAGFEFDAVPKELQEACAELGALIFKGGPRTGQTDRSRQRGKTTFIGMLPDRTRMVIERYAAHGRPRMFAAAAA